MNITFKKASPEHEALIMGWLVEPHMIEFWDNTQEHKDDILNFIYGRAQTYFGGGFTYWVGYLDDEPHAFILSEELHRGTKDLPTIHYQHMSEQGMSVGLDFGIGNPSFIGKGLAVPTLKAFMDFYQGMNPKVDTFLVDPDPNNPRACHVYEKAGFKKVGHFEATEGAFQLQESVLMVRKIY